MLSILMQSFINMKNSIYEQHVKRAIKSLEELNIPNAKFDYKVYEHEWIDIYHNISDFISNDDNIAYLVGEILKKELIDKGFTKFSFYEKG